MISHHKVHNVEVLHMEEKVDNKYSKPNMVMVKNNGVYL